MVDDEASRSYLNQMLTVGLKVLKNKLSEYVRLAAAGETVLVTDRAVWSRNWGHPALVSRESCPTRYSLEGSARAG